MTAGVLAGIIYAFAISDMPGRARTDGRTAVAAMQKVNVAILRPWFVVCFLDSPLLMPAACALNAAGGRRRVAAWVAAAFAR